MRVLEVCTALASRKGTVTLHGMVLGHNDDKAKGIHFSPNQRLHTVPNTVPPFWPLASDLSFLHPAVINEVSADMRCNK